MQLIPGSPVWSSTWYFASNKCFSPQNTKYKLYFFAMAWEYTPETPPKTHTHTHKARAGAEGGREGESASEPSTMTINKQKEKPLLAKEIKDIVGIFEIT